MCVRACVCAHEKERERERKGEIKPVKLRLALGVACGRELDCIYGFGGEEHERKGLLRRPGCRWEGSVNVKEKG